MNTIAIGILLNLLLIPALWLFSLAVRIPAYTMLALLNVLFYLFGMIYFLRAMSPDENRSGFTLRFVLLQLFLLAALFLFKLTELLLLRAAA